MERIRIDQVVTDRDPDSAEPLPSDRDIVQTPIIVRRADMVLIDGFRRLQYWRSVNAKTIAAIMVDTFDEACTALEEQHKGRTLKPAEYWNILRVMYPWGLERSRAQRVASIAAARISGQKLGKARNPLRERMRVVLNANSGHTLASTLAVFRSAEDGNKLAQELAEEVRQGQRSIYSARDALFRGTPIRGNVREVGEQKTLLENGSRNLGAQVGALLKLGSPILVDDEDLENAIQSLTLHRSKLTTFINQLRNVRRERAHG